jgi:hypothetical protein
VPVQRRREPVPVTAELALQSTPQETKRVPVTAADRAAESELVALLADRRSPQGADADAFWAEALDGESGGFGDGLSFDEAMAQGLLPPTFGVRLG